MTLCWVSRVSVVLTAEDTMVLVSIKGAMRDITEICERNSNAHNPTFDPSKFAVMVCPPIPRLLH